MRSRPPPVLHSLSKEALEVKKAEKKARPEKDREKDKKRKDDKQRSAQDVPEGASVAAHSEVELPSFHCTAAPFTDASPEWKRVGELGRGAFGVVHAVSCASHPHAALKQCTTQDGAQSQLKFELIQYKKVDGLPGFPRLLDPPTRNVPLGPAKLPKVLDYIVIERLGADLQQGARPLPATQVSSVGRQLVHTLRGLHERSLVYRDLKPENICWGHAQAQADEVFLIDLGLVGQAHTGDRALGCERGNVTFSGSNYYGGEVYSYRDDLEAVGLVMAYLFNVPFPWDGATAARSANRDKEIAELKGKDPHEWMNGSAAKTAVAEFIAAARALDSGDLSRERYEELIQLAMKVAGD